MGIRKCLFIVIASFVAKILDWPLIFIKNDLQDVFSFWPSGTGSSTLDFLPSKEPIRYIIAGARSSILLRHNINNSNFPSISFSHFV